MFVTSAIILHNLSNQTCQWSTRKVLFIDYFKNLELWTKILVSEFVELIKLVIYHFLTRKIIISPKYSILYSYV